MAGYSATPLARKLGLADESHVLLVGASGDYKALLQPLPRGVMFDSRISAATDIDVKVCAIDDVWSRLKLVIRKKLR